MIAIVAAISATVARESGNKPMALLKAWDAKAAGKVKAATKATIQAIQPGSD